MPQPKHEAVGAVEVGDRPDGRKSPDMDLGSSRVAAHRSHVNFVNKLRKQLEHERSNTGTRGLGLAAAATAATKAAEDRAP